MSKLIPPTPGRVVWYWPSQQELDAKSFCFEDPTQPLAATVAYVHGDRLVNLSIVDQAGAQFRRTSVKLLQEDDARPHTSEGPFAEWMPHQRAQNEKLLAEPVNIPLAALTIGKQAADGSTSEVETKVYTDGATATGTPPLPDQSPAQQVAEATASAAPAPAPAPVAAKKPKAKA